MSNSRDSLQAAASEAIIAPDDLDEGEGTAYDHSDRLSRLTTAYALTAPIDPSEILSCMPTLEYLARKKQQAIPDVFQQFHFIFILHFLSDLIGFMEALRMLGLPWERAHFLYKDYLYPHRDRIVRQLVGHRADVMPLSKENPDVLKTVLTNIINESKSDGRKIIVVEDGGYIVPLVHREFSADIDSFQGAVEQTTKGVNQDLEVRPLRFPVLSVAGAKIKLAKESPEVAKAVWKNILDLLWNRDPREFDTVLVVGYGSIGSFLAKYLKSSGIGDVRVFDQDPNRRDEAKTAGFNVADDMIDLIKGKPGLIVIGATGKASIGRRELLALENNSILVSASSDQHEIGVIELKLLSDNPKPIHRPVTGEKTGDRYRIRRTNNEVTLLAEGFPVNFRYAESLPYRISQVPLVPLYLSAIALASRIDELEAGEPNATFVDQLVDEEEVYDEL